MNYYEETINQLKELIYEKDYKQALKIIETELSMPYVPRDFESKLYEFRNKIISLSDTPIANKMNEDKLFELLESDSLDKIEKIGLIDELNKVNLRNHLHEFDVIFKDESFDDELKTILLYLIYGQQIDHDFNIRYKSNDNKDVLFNTLRTDLKEYEMVPLQIISLFDDELGDNNIQLLEMSKQLTTAMYYTLFPLMKEIDTYNMKEALMHKLTTSTGLEHNPKNVDQRYEHYLELLKKNGII